MTIITEKNQIRYFFKINTRINKEQAQATLKKGRIKRTQNQNSTIP